MEHLALEIFDLPTAENPRPTSSQFATLPENSSITITDTSEIFASGDVWSYSFTLNVRANAHIIGTAGDIHGSRLHDVLDHRRARLWADGIAIYLGYLRLDDEAAVDDDGNVDVTFESGQKTFDEMIEGSKANQVPLMSDVPIGVALWRKRWAHARLTLSASIELEEGGLGYPATDVTYDGSERSTIEFQTDGEAEGHAVQEYPKMMFPRGHFEPEREGVSGDIDYINTDHPYDDAHPYCNVALCYQRYGYDKKTEDGNVIQDYSASPEAQRGYEVMPADRLNSAPNFYVIYWIRALMKHLGIYIEENQMMDVEDLRRLFFVNTNCAYREPKHMRGSNPDEGYERYHFADGIRLVPEWFGKKKREKVDGTTYDIYEGQERIIDPTKCGFTVQPGFSVGAFTPATDNFRPKETPVLKGLRISAKKVIGMSDIIRSAYEDNNSILHDAFATSDCFPNVDISEAIKAIEDGFGIRLLFSDDFKRVRIVLLRNIFNDKEIQTVPCDIISETKEENSIRGFRMTYGKTDDTEFYYKGFNDKLPHKKPYFIDDSDDHDYSHWDLDALYSDILHRISAFDKTCYVTPVNGNAYGIKIDKDAKRYEDLHPSLFEFAGFMDAEDGDCSGEDSTIQEITMGFTPAIMNDVNFENERGEEGGTDGSDKQLFALFVSEKMQPRRPSLNDNTDYNKPDAAYFIDELPEGVTDRRYLYEKNENGQYIFGDMMSDDGIVKPGEFAITSDMNVTQQGLSSTVRCKVRGYISGGHGTIEGDGYVKANVTGISIIGHINEGYRMYLQDNYEPTDDGDAPIEAKDWGLTLGIMRGSGTDAYVDYMADPQDDEGNDSWEREAGSSVTSHPDTCDSYGNEWNYYSTETVTPQTAPAKIQQLFPDSDAPFNDNTLGYITDTAWFYAKDSQGVKHVMLVASAYSIAGQTVNFTDDIQAWCRMTVDEVRAISDGGRHMLIEVDSSKERGNTLVQLCALAYGSATEPMKIDGGVGSRYGRFSLKLRAQKLNPYFDPKRPESSSNRRYLTIANEDLRQRGLMDQFYKEYSYWIRNARVCKRVVKMGLADLLRLDKTKKQTIGDVTGFIRKIQYTIDNQKGLGTVTIEIMYI